MSESVPTSPLTESPRRTILYYAAQDAMGPMTDVILARLGYQIVLPETFELLREEDPSLRAELRLVDERRLDELPEWQSESQQAAPPIVLLTGKLGSRSDEEGIIGAVKRPAGLHDLYRLMQQVFEDRPRSTPRAATKLPAHCAFRGESWEGRVISLSENGCLLRSSEAILLGQRLQLELVLPLGKSIELEAEATYQLLPDTGLVFNALPPSSREAIGRYVTESILS